MVGKWQLMHSKTVSDTAHEYDAKREPNQYFKTFLNDSIFLLQDNFKNAKLLRYSLKSDTMVFESSQYVLSINDDEMVLRNVELGTTYHHKKVKYH